MSDIVILGAGQAGSQVALSLRQMGFDGGITIVGDETHLPYERPPLSKAVLKSEQAIERCVFRPANVYQEQGIDLRLGVRATGIDQTDKSVSLSDESCLSYDQLVVATGTRARSLPLPDSIKDRTFLVRSWDESLALKKFLETAAKDLPLVVVGGGFIGLEVAASARKLGWQVILVEAGSRLMERAVHPALSQAALDKHRAEGSTVYLATKSGEFEASETGTVSLKLGDQKLNCAGLVIGIGALPNVECLVGSSIHDSSGVKTDAEQRTLDPNIYAVGDVAVCRDRYLASGVRLESVQNAIYGAKLCAASITGSAGPRLEAPWFWTDQFDYSIQMVGIYDPSYRWIERRGEGGSLTLIGLEGSLVRAGQVINASQDFAVLRRAIDTQIEVDAEGLSDTSIKLKDLILKKKIA